jgi:hypothetical protein
MDACIMIVHMDNFMHRLRNNVSNKTYGVTQPTTNYSVMELQPILHHQKKK